MKNTLFAVAFLATIAGWIISCNEDTPIVGDGTSQAPTVVPITSLLVSPVTLSLNIGKTGTLLANIQPANATNTSVTWTSSNNLVATVDSKGVVTGVSAGNAVVTATAGGKSSTCSIVISTSIVPVQSVSITPTSASMNSGTTKTLTATVLPTNATNKTVSWSSSNTAVATVSSSGVVSGVSGGIATISASAGGQIATCTMTVVAVKVVYAVYTSSCTGCGRCLPACSVGAITISNRKAVIDPNKCNGCGKCVSYCPHSAIYKK